MRATVATMWSHSRPGADWEAQLHICVPNLQPPQAQTHIHAQLHNDRMHLWELGFDPPILRLTKRSAIHHSHHSQHDANRKAPYSVWTVYFLPNFKMQIKCNYFSHTKNNDRKSCSPWLALGESPSVEPCPGLKHCCCTPNLKQQCGVWSLDRALETQSYVVERSSANTADALHTTSGQWKQHGSFTGPEWPLEMPWSDIWVNNFI